MGQMAGGSENFVVLLGVHVGDYCPHAGPEVTDTLNMTGAGGYFWGEYHPMSANKSAVAAVTPDFSEPAMG